MTYGIKIAKPGKSVNSADMRDLSVDMNTFNMFKLHSTSTTSVTINAGDTEKSTTVSHGLGYVPAFLVYYKRSDESVERLIPDVPASVGPELYPWAYATTTGVTVGYSLADPYNQIVYNSDQTYYDFWIPDTGPGIIVGNAGAGGKGTAIRFPNVALNKDQSLVSVQLSVNHCFSGSATTDTPYKIYGIDEDNVGDVDTSKTKTTAYDARNQAHVSDFWDFGTDCKDQVDEIIARAGWVSGNNLGFIFQDDAADTNEYIGADTSNNSVLTIIKSGTFTIPFRVLIFKDKIAD